MFRAGNSCRRWDTAAGVSETRQHLGAFARHFASNSIALAAFFTAFWTLQDHDRTLAMGGAWTAFAAAATTLHLIRRQSRRAQQVADSSN